MQKQEINSRPTKAVWNVGPWVQINTSKVSHIRSEASKSEINGQLFEGKGNRCAQVSPRQLGLWKPVLAQVWWLLLPYVLSRHGMQEEERDCESEKTGPFSHPCLICLQVHRANPQVEKYIADGTFQKETASCSKAFRNIRKRQPMSFWSQS